jgi:ABC-type antimicrobial peptide transport system permease subunit
MRIPIARGRGLTTDDVIRRRPVALVSQAAARRYWSGQDPVGRRITVDALGADSIEIVGVAGDVRNSDVDQGPAAQVYVPFTRLPSRQMAVVVRTLDANPAALSASIRREVARLDDTQAVFDIRSMADVLFEDTAGSMLVAVLLGSIGFVALCLAAAGVYGLVSYAVQQRTREIGIRVAVGAAPRAVVTLVLMHGVRPVVIGAGVGALGAFLLALLAGAAMNEVDFRDPWNYAGVIVALVSIAVLSSYLPARRAARLDPVVALRAE